MAARTRSKAKDAASDGPEAAGDAPAKPRASAKKASKTALARKPAAKSAGRVKTAAERSKTRGNAAAKTAARAAAGDERQMLIEQNEALAAELDAARARIAQLEKVHSDVIDRIDWVIDSLQTALEEKG